MTLLELTVVILVLLGLTSILFIGAQSWKRGSDRALCILNLRHFQQGLRSWVNYHGHAPGATVENLADFIIGPGLFVEVAPSCPGGGLYSIPGGDVIPPIGTLYVECSFSAIRQHEPVSHDDW